MADNIQHEDFGEKIGGAKNAGLLAVRILGAANPQLHDRMRDYQVDLERMVSQKDSALQRKL